MDRGVLRLQQQRLILPLSMPRELQIAQGTGLWLATAFNVLLRAATRASFPIEYVTSHDALAGVIHFLSLRFRNCVVRAVLLAQSVAPLSRLKHRPGDWRI